MMARMIRAIFVLLILVSCAAVLMTAQAPQGVTIRVGRLIDGRGGTQQNVVVTDRRRQDRQRRQGGPARSPTTCRSTRCCPASSTLHVHILWHFGKDGRFVGAGETPRTRLKAGVENARVTVMSGFTTVQSVGEQRGPRSAHGAREGQPARPAHPDLGPPDQRANRRSAARRDRAAARPINCARRSARRRRRAPI